MSHFVSASVLSATESSSVCLRNHTRFKNSVTVKNEGLFYGASKPNIENTREGLEIHQKNEEECIRVLIHHPSPPSFFTNKDRPEDEGVSDSLNMCGLEVRVKISLFYFCQRDKVII